MRLAVGGWLLKFGARAESDFCNREVRTTSSHSGPIRTPSPELPNYQTTELPNYRTTELPNYRDWRRPPVCARINYYLVAMSTFQSARFFSRLTTAAVLLVSVGLPALARAQSKPSLATVAREESERRKPLRMVPAQAPQHQILPPGPRKKTPRLRTTRRGKPTGTLA